MGGATSKTTIRIQDPRNGSQATSVPKISFDDIKFVGATLQEVLGTSATLISATTDASSGVVGSGAAAVVRRGQWKGKDVAVKVYHPGCEAQDFVKEVTTLSSLQHPAMVELFGICNDHGRFGLVMEYLPMGSLEDYLRSKDRSAITIKASRHTASGRKLPGQLIVNKKLEDASDWPLLFRFATDISAAMAYVHSQGFLHRDLKPSNILIYSLEESAEVTAKLCDFGAGRRGAQQMTNLVGTVPYMAPEMFESTSYGQAIDVYSFGIVLWEMMTRELPYQDMFMHDIVQHVSSGKRLPIPSFVPPPVRELIERCWAGNPESRPTFERVYQFLRMLATEIFELTLETMSKQLRDVQAIRETGRFNESMTLTVALIDSESQSQRGTLVSSSEVPSPEKAQVGRATPSQDGTKLTEPEEEEDDDEDDDEYDESDEDQSDDDSGQGREESRVEDLRLKLIGILTGEHQPIVPEPIDSTPKRVTKQRIFVKKSKVAVTSKKRQSKITLADIGGAIRMRAGSLSNEIGDKLNSSQAALPLASEAVDTSVSSEKAASDSTNLSLKALPLQGIQPQASSSLTTPRSKASLILDEDLPASPRGGEKKRVQLAGGLDTPFSTVAILRDFTPSLPSSGSSNNLL